ncbi:MAG: hypothetical protein SV775_01515 [Thermodesulfobacteriota bacterium]|nr:hypothetical protein [Thermodesulfobacteriota bacterium]
MPVDWDIVSEVDEREIEQGYANFHRELNRILRAGDVKVFKTHIASHPRQAGKLSHCLGLNDELAKIEMYRAILVRSALKDLHKETLEWLKERNIEPPVRKILRKKTKTAQMRRRAR